MSENSRAFHYVCTLEEAHALIGQHDRYWLANCGCREKRGGCARSRTDLCLQFRDDTGVGDSSRREASREQVEAVLAEAREKHLVPRPFRDEATLSRTDGICFCCDDCCAYFLDRSERCDKGVYIERTDMANCTDCGVCVSVCHFGARGMDESSLVVQRHNCCGCGLCVETCLQDSIAMEPR